MEEKYLISKNEMLSFLRYEILYKWRQSAKIKPENKTFENYLLNDTPYQPNHPFIQSFCSTKEEKEDPINTDIYKHIRPADVARYQLKEQYTPYKKR